ncbi:hypothetical protein [Longimicrobium sp.]|uniref:hypothetical protein n=1 Tax=Longimicrobium sp. TaxID=2029185 RepID=UPI002E351EE6|nr:hypothetical protein [Longimicrobium sp.]HEX6038860.1 hypothetical protein [Longimicrobium sp.]
MHEPASIVWVARISAVVFVVVAAYVACDITRLLRAHRRMARVLAEREEYRPLLDTLAARARQNGGTLRLSERESLDVRDKVREALVFLQPGDRKRIAPRLRGRSVSGYEGYLWNLLLTSMNQLDETRHPA